MIGLLIAVFACIYFYVEEKSGASHHSRGQ